MKKRKLKPKFVKLGQRILCSLCAFLLVTGGINGWFPLKANAKGPDLFFEGFENYIPKDQSDMEANGWLFLITMEMGEIGII